LSCTHIQQTEPYSTVLSNPRAACGPPTDFKDSVLAKFVKHNIMCKQSSKRQNLTSHLTISTQIKFFKFIKYTVLNPQVRETESNNYIASFKLAS